AVALSLSTRPRLHRGWTKSDPRAKLCVLMRLAFLSALLLQAALPALAQDVPLFTADFPPEGVRRPARGGVRRDRGRGRGHPARRAQPFGIHALPADQRAVLPLRHRGSARVPTSRR